MFSNGGHENGHDGQCQKYNVTVCRLMLPDDANFAGNVHGGTLLKLIEEAGGIAARRYINDKAPGEDCLILAARVEHTDFIRAVYIGDVLEINAQITYTSERSMECFVEVYAEDMKSTEGKRLTNKAIVWYVAMTGPTRSQILTIPPMTFCTAEEEEEGRQRYEKQKALRWTTKHTAGVITGTTTNNKDAEQNSVAASQSIVMQLVRPSDCASDCEFARAGVLLKWMDECAAIVAMKHCKTNVVTASLDAINFHKKIPKACLVTLSGKLTFSSSKSLEIEMLVDVQDLIHSSQPSRAVDAFFTFVSLDEKGKALSVPPVKPVTSEEKHRFAEGQRRYELRKENRRVRKNSRHNSRAAEIYITPL